MLATADMKILGRVDSLETRLAASQQEVVESQRLRYSVFFEEMSAIADSTAFETKLDADPFDEYCQHLLVVDRANGSTAAPKIIASYRLLEQAQSEKAGGFYSSRTFDIDGLVKRHRDKRFLEFGRSCVLPSYRSKRTIELLWQGSWAYVLENHVDVMFGCASFEGTDPDAFSNVLSFLHHEARAPKEWRVAGLGENAISMDRVGAHTINPRQAIREMPPLIKGYLRLGAMIGDQAVIDEQFGTIDILIILPISHLNPRYVKYYGPNAERHRASHSTESQ